MLIDNKTSSGIINYINTSNHYLLKRNEENSLATENPKT
jgi:hypothetical protein